MVAMQCMQLQKGHHACNCYTKPLDLYCADRDCDSVVNFMRASNKYFKRRKYYKTPLKLESPRNSKLRGTVTHGAPRWEC